MKMRYVLAFLFVILALLMAIWASWAVGHFIPQKVRSTPANITQTITPIIPPPESIATPRNLEYQDYFLTIADLTDSQMAEVIPADQAVTVALEVFPINPALSRAKSYTKWLGVLKNENIPFLSEGRLVWILTFQGIDTISSGPPDRKDHFVSNEFLVAINARTGDYILSFPIPDMTPEPKTTAPMSNPLWAEGITISETISLVTNLTLSQQCISEIVSKPRF